MSARLRGVYGHDLRRDETESVPCARLAQEAAGGDWLSVNLWSPDPAPGAGLPVLVWIPGGGYVIGTSSLPEFDGGRLAGGGVVVVTLNYRLGVEGFAQTRGGAGAPGCIQPHEMRTPLTGIRTGQGPFPLVVAGGGFEPPKAKPTVLQTLPRQCHDQRERRWRPWVALVVVLADQIDEQLTQPRCRGDIDLAPDVDDLDAVLVLVTQLQIHQSSSAMHGVIATSIPANGPA